MSSGDTSKLRVSVMKKKDVVEQLSKCLDLRSKRPRLRSSTFPKPNPKAVNLGKGPTFLSSQSHRFIVIRYNISTYIHDETCALQRRHVYSQCPSHAYRSLTCFPRRTSEVPSSTASAATVAAASYPPFLPQMH